MTSISAIETQITGVLSEITDFKTVLDYEPMEITTLPAATSFYTGFNLTDATVPNVQRVTHRWAVRVYVLLQDAKTAQDEIKSLIPKVVSAFKANRSLTSTCEFSILTGCEVGVILDQNKAQIVADFTLEAQIRER